MKDLGLCDFKWHENSFRILLPHNIKKMCLYSCELNKSKKMNWGENWFFPYFVAGNSATDVPSMLFSSLLGLL